MARGQAFARPAVILVRTDGGEELRQVGEDFADRLAEDDLVEAVQQLGLAPTDQEPPARGNPEPSEKAFPADSLKPYYLGSQSAVTALSGRVPEARDDARWMNAEYERFLESVQVKAENLPPVRRSFGFRRFCQGRVQHGPRFYGMLAPQSSFFPELFEARYRYSGVALARELSAPVAGGVAPFIATALLAATGTYWPIAAYIIGLCAITLVSVYVTHETYQRDISEPRPRSG